MGRGRKAQAGAAVLIVLIALLIILYVLFLPPAERAALLGESTPTVPGAPGAPAPEEVLIYSSVPSVAQPSEPLVREFSPFTVRTQTSGNVLAERSSLEVARTAFHSDVAEMRFLVPDAAENILLSFSVAEANGGLRVYLNDEPILTQELARRQPGPVALPSALLREENVLRFEAAPVGFAIWSRNAYALRNVRITADVTEFGQAAQTLRFVARDLDTLERAGLVFVPDCLEAAGRLSVLLNEQTIYSGHPACGIPQEMDLALSRLVEGENALTWNVAEGRYVIDQAAVFLAYEDEDVAESFTIAPALLSRVVAEDRDILLRLSFPRAGAEGTILLNGEELTFRTHKQQFAGPITRYVRAGTNELQLVETTADVTALEVLVGE